MTKFLSTILLTFGIICSFGEIALAKGDKIVLVIGKNIVTSTQLDAREMLLKDLQGITSPSPAEASMIKNISASSIQDEILMTQELAKRKVKISNNEVEQFISRLQESRGLPNDFFYNRYKNKPLIYESFFEKIRGEVAKTRLVNEIVASLEISQQEVEEMAMKYYKKDAELSMRKFSINDTSQNGRNRLKNIQSTYSRCDKKFVDSIVKHRVVNNILSKMPQKEQNIVSDIRDHDFSAIIEEGDELVMYQICNKKLIGISEGEIENITNVVGNKTLSLKFVKYIETLRKKSYIKKFY